MGPSKEDPSIGSVQARGILGVLLQVVDEGADEQQDHALLRNGQGVKERRVDVVGGPGFHSATLSCTSPLKVAVRWNLRLHYSCSPKFVLLAPNE